MFPLSGGRNTFIKDLVKELKNDFNFKIISFEKNSNKYYNVITINKKFKNNTLSLIQFYWSSYQLLKKLSKKEDINLIIGTGLSSFGGIFFAKKYGIPSILNTSGLRGGNQYEQLLYQNINETKKKRSLFNIFKYFRHGLTLSADRLSAKLSTTITIPTEYYKTILSSHKNKFYKTISDKLIVITEGLNSANLIKKDNNIILKKIGFKRTDKIILISRIENEEFKRKLSSYINKNSDIKIIIMETETMEVFKNNKLITNKITAKEAMQISNAMFCIPQEEPHSFSVLENLYFKKPVFVSNTSWLKYEFSTHPEFIIKELSIKSIFDKINYYYKNKDYLDKRSLEVRSNQLKKYDFKKTVLDYKKLFSIPQKRTTKRRSMVLNKQKGNMYGFGE